MTGPAGSADPQVRPEVPPATPAAEALFGPTLERAERYARLLAGVGIAHGHLGPRELPRLWDRHLANCAVVTDLLPPGASIVDVGSGAGLPGLPMAIRRADLDVVLLEPMARRTAFLEQAVEELQLASRVRVVRGRAEEQTAMRAGADFVTARAVAPLERLLGWCVPLLRPGGLLLALKGSSAADEVARWRTGARRSLRAAVQEIEVVEVGREYGMEPTQVVRVERSTQRRRSG